jgi:DNA-directed RNA polymerase specialized sigma24 family protein
MHDKIVALSATAWVWNVSCFADQGREHMRKTSKFEARRLCGSSEIIDGPAANAPSANKYAKCEDFRRVFLENLDSLYQLSILLTNNPHTAKQCLIDALDECVRSQQVFREWALCWARRILIRNAVRALRPRADRVESSRKPKFTNENPKNQQDPCFNVAAVLSLQHFERFVLVLSVLDEYSDRDCALLLGCFVEDIRNARVLALRQVAVSTDTAVRFPSMESHGPIWKSVEWRSKAS